MVAVHVMHMTIMEVAVVIAVLNSLVTTAVAVLMIVLSVNFTRHLNSPYPISKNLKHTLLNSGIFFHFAWA